MKTFNLTSRVFALIVLILCSTTLSAQKRSREEAMSIARGFLSERIKPSEALRIVSPGSAAKRAKSRTGAEAGGEGFYVVADAKSHAFVLVGGDERMSDILGYSLDNNFGEDNIAPGLLDLLEGYQRLYDKLQELPATEQAERGKRSAARKVTPVEPLITTQWDQGAPYNNLCPDIAGKPGEKACSGCVATAMAQVMNYYKYPAAATGDIAYQNHGTGLSASLRSIPLDWSSMCDEYGDNNTRKQNDAVANLMKACGYSVYMEYGCNSGGESSAYNADMAYALINNFGYNPNLSLKARDYYTIDEWTSMIDNELANRRPILYSGTNGSNSGHEFILDGVREDGLYHFNFGWSGLGDGYYDIIAVKPMFWGIIQLGDYSYDHEMVIYISPETVSEKEDMFYSPMFNLTVQQSYVIFNTDPVCYSTSAQSWSVECAQTFDGEIGVGLFDANWTLVKPLSKKEVSWKAYTSWTNGYTGRFKIDSSLCGNGSQRYIALYAKDSATGSVTRMRTKGGMSDWYLMTVENGSAKLEQRGVIDVSSGIEDNIAATARQTVTASAGSLTITTAESKTVVIYNINGQTQATIRCAAGTPETVSLPSGIYIIGGKKYKVA